MKQSDAVYIAMRDMGGYATLGQLNAKALQVPGAEWNTKTPFASIRRIVQDVTRFFKIRPGLWALEEQKAKILKQFEIEENALKEVREEFDHGYYQGLLVEIGNLSKYRTFVPYQDKNRRFLDRKLTDVTTLPKFLDFTYEHVLRKAITVDVTWFNERGYPEYFYEVEHSTDIYNSLLKFVELQDFNVNFRIVADKARQPEFKDRLSGQAFTPIKERVLFLSYDTVSNMHTQEFKHAGAAAQFYR